MDIQIEALTDAQLAVAGNLAGRRLLVVGLQRAGWSTDEIETKLNEVIAKLVEQPAISDSEQQKVLGALRSVYPALEEMGGEIDDVAATSLDLANDASDAHSWASDASKVIVNTGFSIALLIITAQVGVKGKLGPFEIEKPPGFPVEIVQVVEAIAKVAATALTHGEEPRGPGGDASN